MKRKSIMCLLAAALLFSLSGCQAKQDQKNTDAAEASSVSGTVTLAAAASLEYAFEEKIIPQFEEKYPEVTIEGTYDSSGKLQQQIESGLAADLFFSAAEKQMQELDAEGMIDSETITNLLENKIVLIVPSDSDTQISEFQDIANASSVALGDPESVPVGQYARESLTNLGIWDNVSSRCSFGTNVTEVLNWIAESSADCGIVYATDAATTDKVKIIAEAPSDSLQSPVLYPVALTKEAPNKEAATAFLEYITSDDAMTVFEEYGFADNRALAD